MRAVLLLAACLVSTAEIIDRIAVTVGNQVITESMILLQIRMAAFLDGREPDYTPKEMRQTAERIVDQVLLSQEMDDARYPEPAMADIIEELRELQEERFPKDEAAYQRELARRNIDESDLRQFLQLQTRTMDFLNVRFRTGVQVSTDEINTYYERSLRPTFEKQKKPVPPIEDVFEEIESILMGKKVDDATEEWLKQARLLKKINFRGEVFPGESGP